MNSIKLNIQSKKIHKNLVVVPKGFTMIRTLFHKNLVIGDHGFTMIELLITMSIIAILATLSLFALRGARESARDGKRKSDLETIRSALELYKSDCNVYPTGTLTSGGSISANCSGGNVYLQAVPDDPVTGRDYYYNRNTTTTYTLCASLEDLNPTPTAAPANCGSCGSGVLCHYKVVNP